MRRSTLILAAFITFIATSLAFITADEPLYKNLKVLKKNTTKKELDSVMHFFTVSLGEKCTFCHVRNEAAKSMDFVTDENPNKNVARFMMRMATKLNKKYFKDKDKDDDNEAKTMDAVTCYTCHHGVGHPAVKPAAAPANNGGMPQGNMKPSMPADSSKVPH
ncbi:MAG: c-type cytochrome [Ginsengibacter sp.]